jgi:hypothetical protein
MSAIPGLQLMTYGITFQLNAVEGPTAPLIATSSPGSEGRVSLYNDA